MFEMLPAASALSFSIQTAETSPPTPASPAGPTCPEALHERNWSSVDTGCWQWKTGRLCTGLTASLVGTTQPLPASLRPDQQVPALESDACGSDLQESLGLGTPTVDKSELPSAASGPGRWTWRWRFSSSESLTAGSVWDPRPTQGGGLGTGRGLSRGQSWFCS